MARKAKVNKEEILAMLRDGETTQYIAEQYNVSRQAIDLHRKDFIKKGLLPDKRASRSRKANIEYPHSQKPITSPTPPSSAKTAVSLDAQIDLMIAAFSALKELPALRKELEASRRENEKIQREIESLQEQLKTRLDQENRWFLTQSDENTTSS